MAALASRQARSASSAAASSSLTRSASSLARARTAGRSPGSAFPTDRETSFCSARHRGVPAQKPTGPVAEQIAQDVVTGDDEENQRACGQDRRGGRGHDGEDHVADAENRDPRHSRQDPLDGSPEQKAHEQAADDGDEHHRDDAPGHGAGIDGHVLTGEPPGEQRGHDRGEQGRYRGHRDAEGDVAPGEVGDDIGGGAARRAPDENDPRGECRGEPEALDEQPGQRRHDGELGDDADQDRQRPPRHEGEVRGRQGQTHAEHDDAQGAIGSRRQRGELRRRQHRDAEGRQDEEGEDGDCGAGGAVFGTRTGPGCGSGHGTVLLRAQPAGTGRLDWRVQDVVAPNPPLGRPARIVGSSSSLTGARAARAAGRRRRSGPGVCRPGRPAGRCAPGSWACPRPPLRCVPAGSTFRRTTA